MCLIHNRKAAAQRFERGNEYVKSNKHNIKKAPVRDGILEVLVQAVSTALLPEKTNPDSELRNSGLDVLIAAVLEQSV